MHADGTERLARALELQGDACERFGSRLYGALMRAAADDVRFGGPVAAVLAGHEDDPGASALALRLFGPVHRLVLAGRAPALAAYYPSAGGTAPAGERAEHAWPAFRAVVAEHADVLRHEIDQVPQTNEPGRAAGLLGGLLWVLAGLPRPLPVRLFEIGASAGVNLRADHACVRNGEAVVWGDGASPFQLPDAWHGPLPPLDPPVDVVERIGCDLAPIDPTSVEGRQRLLSYVWPDTIARFARLEGALAVAAEVPATVQRRGAADFVDQVGPAQGALTVVWHSIMWQYLTPEERQRCGRSIDRAGAAADDRAPLAHIALEPRRLAEGEAQRFVIAVTVWPGGHEVILGEAHPHGIPVEWWDPAAARADG